MSKNRQVVRIALSGCDDTTVFHLSVTPADRELLERVAEASQETSQYHCMPVMLISDVEVEAGDE